MKNEIIDIEGKQYSRCIYCGELVDLHDFENGWSMSPNEFEAWHGWCEEIYMQVEISGKNEPL